MTPPFFSIVTAIKDGLELFKTTVPTILNQSFRDWEWIVIDDCSSEGIEAYLNALQDPRIRFFKNTKAQGQTRSLNFGIKQSLSNWIVRMDGDDLADLKRLERTHGRIVKASDLHPPLIFSDYKVIAEGGELLTTVRYKEPLSFGFYNYFVRNNPICHPSVTFYKFSPSGETYQFDENLKNAQDYALWKKIRSDYGDRFAHLDEALISYRLVRSSLSGARAAEQKIELQLIRENDTEKAMKQAKVLNSEQQDGMYAFRILYYRFVGQQNSTMCSEDLQLLGQTFQYPSVVLKSAAFLAMRPFKSQLKKFLFQNIYQ